MSEKWPFVINLANSIIGVSVLTMPFCFNKCGVILGMLSLCCCAFLTKRSCGLLLKAAHIARSRTYELLALHTYGPGGKLTVELCIIGLLLGTCVAFFVIIGDLAPEIVHSLTGIQPSWGLRTFLMIVCGCGVLLLGFMRNIQSLSGMSAISLGFYAVFVTYILIGSLPHMLSRQVWSKVDVWKPQGLLQCIPIFSLSFACQTQLFVLYDAMAEPSLKKMEDVITTGVNLVTCIYCSVGVFGYLTFYDVGVNGDILTNYGHGFVIEALKLGFVLSVIISFPLMIFPCRASINSFITYYQGGMDTAPGMGYIPPRRFVMITAAIVGGTLITGILIPNVEFVLGMNGATMGSMIAYILPAVFFLHVITENKNSRLLAKAVLIIGLICFVSSTYSVMNSRHESVDVHTTENDPIKPAIAKVDTISQGVTTSMTSKIDSDVAKIGQALPNIPLQDNIKLPQTFNVTKKEADNIEKREVVPPVMDVNAAGGDSQVNPPLKDNQAAVDSDSRGPVVAPVEHVPVDDSQRHLLDAEEKHAGISRDIKSIIEDTPAVSQAEIDEEIAKLEVKKAEINNEIMKLEDQKVESNTEFDHPVSNVNLTLDKPKDQDKIQNKETNDENNVNNAQLAEAQELKKSEDESRIISEDHHNIKRDEQGGDTVPAAVNSQTSSNSSNNQYQTNNNKSRDLKSNEQDKAQVEKQNDIQLLSRQARDAAEHKTPMKFAMNPILRYKKRNSHFSHKKVSMR